jgi:hypothetical protein
MSKQEAEKAWQPKFIAEIASGKDPRVAPGPQPSRRTSGAATGGSANRKNSSCWTRANV